MFSKEKETLFFSSFFYSFYLAMDMVGRNSYPIYMVLAIINLFFKDVKSLKIPLTEVCLRQSKQMIVSKGELYPFSGKIIH